MKDEWQELLEQREQTLKKISYLIRYMRGILASLLPLPEENLPVQDQEHDRGSCLYCYLSNQEHTDIPEG